MYPNRVLLRAPLRVTIRVPIRVLCSGLGLQGPCAE